MSVHVAKTVSCTTVNDDGDVCMTQLDYPTHGRYEKSLRGDRRDKFEQSALVFTCPDCGGETAMCPVCSDPSDNSPGGWMDTTGEAIPCHNCNMEEINERRRRGVK